MGRPAKTQEHSQEWLCHRSCGNRGGAADSLAAEAASYSFS